MSQKFALFKTFFIALLSSSLINAMHTQEQQCTGWDLQRTALITLANHGLLNILRDDPEFLRDNPEITGPQLATMFQGILPRTIIRHLHQNIWAIRRQIMDSSCASEICAFSRHVTAQAAALRFRSHFLLCETENERQTAHAVRLACDIYACRFKQCSTNNVTCEHICDNLIKLSDEHFTPSWGQWASNLLSYSWLSKPIQQVQPSPIVICLTDFGNLYPPQGSLSNCDRISCALDRIGNKPALVLGLISKKTGKIGHSNINHKVTQDLDLLHLLRDDREIILKNLVPHTRLDLMPTLYELCVRTTGFSCGQLAQLMDEAYLEAAFENSDIQREHIIGAYNRARRQLQGQQHN